ncbi:putative Zn(II)2Cys6 transcription factor [Xylogone sp. PMI_703]|nr:putative Zn(II)2Cys6 transcription factor [Xylogone sp. PMI_703]
MSTVSMAPNLTSRLPLSCENCRQRKIRCIRVGHRTPCDTCLRRGYASTCRFRREGDSVSTNEQHSELLNRIAALEDLIRQTADTRTRSDHGIPSPVSALGAASSSQGTEPSPPASISSGRLIVSASQHVRYVPYKGMGDANLLDAMEEPVVSMTGGFPCFPNSVPFQRQELLYSLPPTKYCDELITIFFNVFSPLFHILHDPSFMDRYREFQHDPQSTPLAFLALLFVVLSLAITALDDQHPLLADLGRESTPAANIRSIAAQYRSAAMRCLSADNFMWQHNLHTVQCLVLLIYAINHAHGPAWPLLGTTLHIAVAIGCAVDPDRLNVDPIEAEERRRCWAALTMLYTIQNTCLGNISPTKVEADVAPPADVDDEDIGSGRHLHVIEPGMSEAPPTKMSYILLKFRLYNLAGDICQLVASASVPDRDVAIRLDERLRSEQQCHITRFADIWSLPVYHIAHFFILSNYTNHLLLLLHRPYVGASGGGRSPQHYDPRGESIEKCEQAAMNVLSNYEILHSKTEFKPYRWYVHGLGSFHAFLAVTTVLVLLGQHDVPEESRIRMEKAMQQCLYLFRNTAARSEICAKATSILDPIMQELQRETNRPATSQVGVAPVAENPALNSLAWEAFQPHPEMEMWNSPPQLESLMNEIACEQWLAPSGFPW